MLYDTKTVGFQNHQLDDTIESHERIAQEKHDAFTENKIELTFDCEVTLVKKGEISKAQFVK